MLLYIESPRVDGNVNIQFIEECKSTEDCLAELCRALKEQHNIQVRFFSSKEMSDSELRKKVLDNCEGVVGKG